MRFGMPTFIQPILCWIRRFWSHRKTSSSDSGRLERARADAVRYLNASKAADRAINALARGDIDTAERFARQGMASEPTHSRLVEIRAWCAMYRKDPQHALRVLDHGLRESGRVASVRKKLLLTNARMMTGQRVDAHLELASWRNSPDFPPEARLLLASLEAEQGNVNQARDILTEDTRYLDHPLIREMLILFDLNESRPESARRIAANLTHAYSADGFVGHWLKSLDMESKDGGYDAPLGMVEELAGELSARPDVILSLVAAQILETRPSRVELLRRALVRIVDDLPSPLEGCIGLAELAKLAGDQDETRRWAAKGLKLDPYCARLALILDELSQSHSSDDEDDAGTIHIDSLEALRRANAAHPQYPDVRRALILNYHRRGLSSFARDQAQDWVHDQPNSRLAQQTLGEVAA